MEIIKDNNNKLYLKINQYECIEITLNLDFKILNKVCIMHLTKQSIPMDLYEILFDNNYKHQLIISETYIPYDIVKNCMKCNYYSACKYNMITLKRPEQSNKILKEYKEFIRNLREIDNE